MRVWVSPPAEVLVEGKVNIEGTVKEESISSGLMTGYRRGNYSSQIYIMLIDSSFSLPFFYHFI